MKKIILNEDKNRIKEPEIIKSTKEDLVDDFTLEQVENHFVTKKAKKFKVEFASNLKDTTLMTITKENHPLKMNFLGKKKRMKKMNDIVGKIHQNKVTYEEVEEGMDLSYLCQENRIKESLIIKTKQDTYDYDFTMDIGELTPRFNEKENVLELTKENKRIYRILSPYMEDSKKQRSEDCSYEIEQNGSLLTLHLHCDTKWMNDDKRVFPVVVDPTIEVDVANIQFARIQNGVAKQPGKYITIGEEGATFHAVKVRINVDDILDKNKGTILSAYICFHIASMNLTETAAYAVVCDGEILNRFFVRKESTEKKLDVNIKKALLLEKKSVELIICSSNDPYLISSNVSTSTDASKTITVCIDETNIAEKPIITVKYNDNIDTRKAYKEYPLGNRDTTKVYLMDGKFSHEHDDNCYIQENNLSVSLKHIYNYLDNKNIGLGSGWTTNLHQFLIKTKEYDYARNGVKIKYIDGEGITHNFYDKFYYVKDKIKHYVSKENVYLDTDQKLKVDVNNETFEIKYETKNDEGLTYVSGSNLTNYKTIHFSDNYDLAIEFADGELLKVPDTYRYGKIRIPYYKEITSKGEVGIPYEHINYKTMTSAVSGNPVEQKGTWEKEIKADKNGIYIECPIALISSGYVAYTYLKFVSRLSAYDSRDDIYITDDIQELDSKIYNLKLSLQSEFVSINGVMDTIDSLQKQIDCQTEIENLSLYTKYQDEFKNFYKEGGWGNKALIQSLGSLDGFGYNSSTDTLVGSESFDTTNTKENANQIISIIRNYIQNLSNRLTIKSNEIKEEYVEGNNSFEVTSLLKQLNSYKEQLDFYYDAINENSKQLTLLQDQRDTLIEEQKKKVNDFIIDKDGNTLGFDGYGRLILIQDKYDNKINIEFGYEEENKDKMLSIYTEKQSIKFDYDKETGLLKSIIDSQGRKTKYVYSDEKLIEIRNDKEDELPTTFNYDNGFKVITPNLNVNEVIVTNDKVTNIKTSCYDGEIGEDTKISEDASTKVVVDHSFTFSENNNNYLTTITDRIKKTTEQYTSSIFAYKDDKETTISVYENQKEVANVKYQNSISPLLTLDNEINLRNYYLNFTSYYSAPYSNLMGILFKIKSDYVGKNLSFEVKTVVYMKDKNNIETENAIENKYDVLSPLIIHPIYAPYDKTKYVAINFISDDLTFTKDIFEEIQLIPLETGTIYQYDGKSRLIKEQDGHTTIKYLDFNENDVPLTKEESDIFGKEIITHYHYDNNQQLTYIEDSKQNVMEYFYDDKGNCIEKRSYNKKDASLMRVEKASYDEKGNIISSLGSIKDLKGEYPREEYTYLPGTNIQSKVVGVNGESTCYQYDKDTGDLLSISSSSNGINNSTAFTYNYGLLTSLSHHGMKVNYTYDGQGRKTRISLNGEVVQSSTYNDNYTSGYMDALNNNTQVSFSGKKVTSTRDGLVVDSYIDNDDKIHYKHFAKANDLEGAVKYDYDSKDRLSKTISQITDKDTNETYKEEVTTNYDNYDSVSRQEKKVNGASQVIIENTYDTNHQFIRDITFTVDNYKVKTSNTYVEDQLKEINLQKVINTDTCESIEHMDLDYDVLGRVKHQNLHVNNVDMCHEYSYLQQDENSLDLISEDITKVKIQNESQTTYLTETSTYQYDVNGNIIEIDQDEIKTRYRYDSLSRLIREDNPFTEKTYVYKYDKAGNILLKKTYNYTLDDVLINPQVDEYIYDCNKRDQLISFNGRSIVYDNMGRPTTYKDETFTWNSLDQLTNIVTQDNVSIKYLYDTNGIRRKKIVNGVETTFITNGTQILSMKQGSKTFIFRYILNKLVGFNYNNGSSTKEYIYQRNIQGDIIGIFAENGVQVGGYAYDGYGNQTITLNIDGVASLNPFRYRGYFYDEETHLNYLNSRYYDPETGRFISPDTLSILDETRGQINGLNLYMYCKDNPIMYVDPSGYLLGWIFAGLAAILTLVYSIAGAVKAYQTSTKLGLTGWERFKYTLSGFLLGDYFVVRDHWNQISKTVNIENNVFDFKYNPYYGIWTAPLYAKDLKEKYYSDEESRTSLGLYIELQGHYLFYLLGNEHATDGAYMGPTNEDKTAYISELIAKIISSLFLPATIDKNSIHFI